MVVRIEINGDCCWKSQIVQQPAGAGGGGYYWHVEKNQNDARSRMSENVKIRAFVKT